MRFSEMRVSTRMQLLTGLVLVGVLVLSITSLAYLRETLLQDRKEKTRNLVEVVHTLIGHHHAMQVAGTLD